MSVLLTRWRVVSLSPCRLKRPPYVLLFSQHSIQDKVSALRSLNEASPLLHSSESLVNSSVILKEPVPKFGDLLSICCCSFVFFSSLNYLIVV